MKLLVSKISAKSITPHIRIRSYINKSEQNERQREEGKYRI